MPCPARITGRLRFVDQRGGLIQFRRRGKEIRDLTVRSRRGGIPIKFAGAKLGIFGDVHEHGAGPVGSGDLEGFAQAGSDFIGARHQIIVLGDGHRDAGNVGFLKGVAAEHGAAHLSGDADDWR